MCSLISTGTERLVSSGKLGLKFQEKMSVPFMEGNFSLPIKYGYSLIVQDEHGKLGHIMHPHQNMINRRENEIFWIDEEIPANRFSLISNMETVINAIWDSNPKINQRIAVCGFGNIGSLLATTLKIHYNIDVTIIEIDEWRKRKAQELDFSLDEGESYDIIYHTTASEAGLQYCINHLNFEGKIIELSWYGDKSLSLDLGFDFHYKRLQIISSQVSKIPGHKPEETYKSRKDLALRMLNDSLYDRLITHKIKFEDTPDFFADLRNGKQEDGLIYIIDY